MKRKYLSMAVGCALLAPAAFVQAGDAASATIDGLGTVSLTFT